jgi:lipopolysaccharide transport system permease protein
MKVRYKSSFFGYLWSIGQPLSFALVYFVAFKVVMRIQMEDYTIFLLSGLFPWQWVQNSFSGSPHIFLGNTSIIKKVNFARNTLVISSILQDMIHFIVAIPVLVIFMFIYDKTPSLSWLYGIPLLLVIQCVFAYGVSLAISSLNLFFRDLERLAVIFITLSFYMTPIIYPVSMFPEKYRPLLNLNPFAPLIISWRRLLLEGVLDFNSIGLSIIYSIIFLLFGQLLYKKLSWKFAEVL